MTDSDHAARMLVGLVWMVAMIMAFDIASVAGYTLTESAVIAVVGPPAFIVGGLGGAWVLGTVLVWLNRKLGLVRLIP